VLTGRTRINILDKDAAGELMATPKSALSLSRTTAAASLDARGRLFEEDSEFNSLVLPTTIVFLS